VEETQRRAPFFAQRFEAERPNMVDLGLEHSAIRAPSVHDRAARLFPLTIFGLGLAASDLAMR
jgi:hypothetical protein